jgi:hypothetical protein
MKAEDFLIYLKYNNQAMEQEKFMTLHPKGKKGTNISKAKYDQIKGYIMKVLNERKIISYQQLNTMAVEELKDSFAGSVPWYLVTVKLDLEARDLIERVPGTRPHLLQLKK